MAQIINCGRLRSLYWQVKIRGLAIINWATRLS